MQEKNIPGIADIKYNDADAILTIRMEHKSDITLEKAKLITTEIESITGDKLHANLVDIRLMTFMGSDARKHFGSQNKKTVLAVAILSNASFHKPLVNLYLKFTRPSLPTKVFNEEEDAIAWLKEVLSVNKV